jgi:hypothetical protein
MVTPNEPPETKFVPTIDTGVPPAIGPEVGAMVLKVGAGAGTVTVNPFVSVPIWASGLVTTTFQEPATAPEMGNVQVIRVGDTTDTPVAAMSN